uniref:BTB domain-containing protein n=1 Tax=Caenorhabditis tropicalis TaxID=1561998 RepID=A0A1I7UKT3_9PELO
MSDRRKYAFNGVYIFENAREHMERADFPEIPIGTIGGIDGWSMKMLVGMTFDETYYYPLLDTINEEITLKHRIFISYVKKDGSLELDSMANTYLRTGFGYSGRGRIVEELLDEENGYLTDGAIIIEYGLQIEAIRSPDNIWTFNFRDPLFDCQEKQNMISFYKDLGNGQKKWLYCHKQLLIHHSTFFDLDSKENELTIENLGSFESFLQISHGVRLKIDDHKTPEILAPARKYGLSNVIQLVDQALDSEITISRAISYGLNHRLANLLRKQESLEELAEELKKVDLETMSGEMMKKCVRRLFEL